MNAMNLNERFSKRLNQWKAKRSMAYNTKNQTSSVHASALRTVEQTADVANAARQLQSAVESISGQVSNQTRLVTDITSVTHASRKDMDHLRLASEEINEIVNIVKHISRETKLLALNARIEAARSGTAGKGFAVVAREVRELSLQTEAANQDIGMKIDSIQGACQALIAAQALAIKASRHSLNGWGRTHSRCNWAGRSTAPV